jgi:hypothetical protein
MKLHSLAFLEAARANAGNVAAGIDVEYRLACSGEFYNRSAVAADRRKSDITRVLLRAPFELFVASQPFDDYPQELCARIQVQQVTESDYSGPVHDTHIFVPDEDIIEDLCSLLTLLSRRLVSPVGKTRERHPRADTGLGSYDSDFPVPILKMPRFAFWSSRPISTVRNAKEQAPPPVGVSAGALTDVLLKLPDIPRATEVVYAARLYRSALEYLESRPDIAYQLLVSTAETLAGADLGVKPHRGANPRRSFKTFLKSFVLPRELSVEDRLFPLQKAFCPRSEDFENALGVIYDARSGNLHSGSPFPRHLSLGLSPLVKEREFRANPLRPKEVPPVAWFERVVSVAARKFLTDKTSSKEAPFTE